MLKTVEEIQQALNDIDQKMKSSENLTEQDHIILLLASLMEEESHGSSREVR